MRKFSTVAFTTLATERKAAIWSKVFHNPEPHLLNCGKNLKYGG